MKIRVYLLFCLMTVCVAVPAGAQSPDGGVVNDSVLESQSLNEVVLRCIGAEPVAKPVHPWLPLLDEITTLDDTEHESWEEMYDVLCQLEDHPLNINSASREQLEHIPFLNAQQVEDIQAYIYQYGAMRSLGELAMIGSIDYYTRRLLTYFVVAAEPEHKDKLRWSDLQKYGRHEVMLTARVPFYERRGDKEGYLGDRFAHTLRYRFQYHDRVSAGLIADQEAGEPFFNKHNRQGYDFYSFYVDVKRLGRLKQLTVGRYRISSGMGLVLNNDFGYGKLSALSSLGRQGDHISPHASRFDRDYLQGAAATVEVSKGLDVTAFVSYRGIDATLTDDGHGVATIVRTGYHRTLTEVNKKNNVNELYLGGMVNYRFGGWRIGAIATYDTFDHPLQPDRSVAYRSNAPKGKSFFHVGANYGYTGHRILFSGETATTDNGGIAIINSFAYQPSWSLTLMALQRYYDPKYSSLHANSFSEGSSVQNENGIMAGVKWQPSQQWQVLAYTDYAYFPEPRYQATQHSSNAWDNLVQAAYTGKRFSASARYRIRYRQRDFSEYNTATKQNEVKGLTNQTVHRWRLTAGYGNERWKILTQADLTLSQFRGNCFGWMVSETLSATVGRWLHLDASFGYFRTDDYESRIYTYDTGILYQYSFSSYDGEGIRYSFLVRADISNRLLFIARLQTVNYFDRSVIGTGLQTIDHSSRTDLQLQLRWKF